MRRYFHLPCPGCGVDLEAELDVESYGSPASWDHPGEGATWYLAAPVTCVDDQIVSGPSAGEIIQGCGRVVQDEELSTLHESAIQEMLAEPWESDYE